MDSWSATVAEVSSRCCDFRPMSNSIVLIHQKGIFEFLSTACVCMTRFREKSTERPSRLLLRDGLWAANTMQKIFPAVTDVSSPVLYYTPKATHALSMHIQTGTTSFLSLVHLQIQHGCWSNSMTARWRHQGGFYSPKLTICSTCYSVNLGRGRVW